LSKRHADGELPQFIVRCGLETSGNVSVWIGLAGNVSSLHKSEVVVACLTPVIEHYLNDTLRD